MKIDTILSWYAKQSRMVRIITYVFLGFVILSIFHPSLFFLYLSGLAFSYIPNTTVKTLSVATLLFIAAAGFLPESNPDNEVTTTSDTSVDSPSNAYQEATSTADASNTEFVPPTESISTDSSTDEYRVVNVVDGDTIDVEIDGTKQRVRLIGVDTPETVDPRKPVECFGREASVFTKNLLSGTSVRLETDPSQGTVDKYDRMLAYVFTSSGTHVNLEIIKQGYGHEYTYNVPYTYQQEFIEAENFARESRAGLWGSECEKTIATPVSIPTETLDMPSGSCEIKGNISSDGEKIYHTPNCQSYLKTKINEDAGERWFCSESDAQDAGWRKALNC